MIKWFYVSKMFPVTEEIENKKLLRMSTKSAVNEAELHWRNRKSSPRALVSLLVSVSTFYFSHFLRFSVFLVQTDVCLPEVATVSTSLVSAAALQLSLS